MIYNVILHGSRATCPLCAGTMVQEGELSWRCIDCRRAFEAKQEGHSEGEILCEEIEVPFHPGAANIGRTAGIPASKLSITLEQFMAASKD